MTTILQQYQLVFNTLTELANHYYFAGNLAESLRLLKLVLEISQSPEIPSKTVAALELEYGEKYLYWATIETGDFLPVMRIAEALLEADSPIERGKAHTLLGASHYHQAMNTKERDFSKAMLFLSDALAILEQEDDAQAIFWARFRFGLCQQYGGFPEQALESFQAADRLALENGLDLERSFSLRHIGFIYQEQGNLEAASSALEESLHLRESLNFRIYLSLSYAALASVYAQGKRDAEAFSLYQKAYHAAKETGIARPLVIVSLDYGTALLDHAQASEARKVFEAALPLARKIGHQQAAMLIEEQLRQIAQDS